MSTCPALYDTATRELVRCELDDDHEGFHENKEHEARWV